MSAAHRRFAPTLAAIHVRPSGHSYAQLLRNRRGCRRHRDLGCLSPGPAWLHEGAGPEPHADRRRHDLAVQRHPAHALFGDRERPARASILARLQRLRELSRRRRGLRRHGEVGLPHRGARRRQAGRVAFGARCTARAGDRSAGAGRAASVFVAPDRALRRCGADRLRAGSGLRRRLPGCDRLRARRAPPGGGGHGRGRGGRGWEGEGGFADAYLVATGFARAARRLGVKIMEGVEVNSLRMEEGRVVGVETSQGDFSAPLVGSAQNIWSKDIERWTGIEQPVKAERHAVLALEGPQPYTFQMPVYKDLGSPGMLYCRSYGGNQMLVSEGIVGDKLDSPDNEQGDMSMDYMVEVGAQVADRFPSYETAGVASSWTGAYDVTPDWNPVLGRLQDVPGLVVGYGFSGHGFKLSPA